MQSALYQDPGQEVQSIKMTKTPEEIVSKLLTNITNLTVVKQLVAHNATCVSLNRSNPELTSIEPWCGLHEKAAPEAIYQTFVDVGTFWRVENFDKCTRLLQVLNKLRSSRLKLYLESISISRSLGLFDIDQTL